MVHNFGLVKILIVLLGHLSCVVAAAATAAPSSRAVEPEPVNLGSRKQLFIDDYIIESLDGATRKLNEPTKHPSNPLIPWLPEDHASWDADLQIYFPSVMYDHQEKIFKLWYGLWERGKGDAASVLAYATSKDGVHWNRPHLGLVEYRGTKENNVLMPRNGLCCGVFKDHHEKDPAKRYKMLHMCSGAYRVCAAHSADGLRWNKYNNGDPVIDEFPDGHFADSHMVCYRDEQLGKYVAIIRQRFDSDGRGRHKCPAMAESDDFVHWTPARPLLRAEQADGKLRQFYCMEVMQYEGWRLGFVTFYHHGAKPDPPYERGQVQLAYSRDGRNWSRWGQDVFLPLSDRPGDFDWGYIYTAHAPVVAGDEIYVYYDGHGHDHRHDLPEGVTERTGGLGLAKLRLDGFVSVEAGRQEGRLTTKPLTFAGKQLVVNADATSGSVIVEVLNGAGEPINGFRKQDCVPLRGNEIRHQVSWQGKSDLRDLEGKTVCLRFHLTKAKLYSFEFTLFNRNTGTHDSGSAVRGKCESNINSSQ